MRCKKSLLACTGLKKTINARPDGNPSEMNHEELMIHSAAKEQADKVAKATSGVACSKKGQSGLKRHGFYKDEEEDDDIAENNKRHGEEHGSANPGDIASEFMNLQRGGKGKRAKLQLHRAGPNDKLTPQEGIPFAAGSGAGGGSAGSGGSGRKAVTTNEMTSGMLDLRGILEDLPSQNRISTVPPAVATIVENPVAPTLARKLRDVIASFDEGLINAEERDQLRAKAFAAFLYEIT